MIKVQYSPDSHRTYKLVVDLWKDGEMDVKSCRLFVDGSIREINCWNKLDILTHRVMHQMALNEAGSCR
jgi:hypothetical protein